MFDEGSIIMANDIGKKIKNTDSLVNMANANIDSIKTIVNTINTNINAVKASNLLNFGSAVKRIQRGTVAYSNTASASRTISVSSVDMSKSYLDVVVYFSKAFTLSGAANTNESIYLSSSTVITQPYSYIIDGTNRYYYHAFTWQLIELY